MQFSPLQVTCMLENKHKRRQQTVRALISLLAGHPKVEKVYYLGLLTEDDPEYPIYRKQCLSPGAMLAFDVAGGEAEAFRFLNSLRLFKLAVSLGSTASAIRQEP